MSKRVGKLAMTVAVAAFLLGSAQFCWAEGGNALKLKDYEDMALQNSPTMKLAALAYEKANLSQIDNKLKGSVVADKQVLIATNAAERALQTSRKDLVLSVQTGYYSLLKVQKALEIATQSEKQAHDQLLMVKTRRQQGVASNLELISAEKQAKSAELAVIKAKNDLDQTRGGFQRIVGTSGDLSLTDEITVEPISISIDEAIKMAQEKSADLAAAEDNLELLDLQYSLTQNDYTADNQKRLAKIALEEAQIGFESKKLDVTTSATNLYIAYMDSLNQIEMSKKTMEYAQENARITEARFKSGLETASALIQSQISLDSAKVESLNAVSNFNVAKTKLLGFIGYAGK